MYSELKIEFRAWQTQACLSHKYIEKQEQKALN